MLSSASQACSKMGCQALQRFVMRCCSAPQALCTKQVCIRCCPSSWPFRCCDKLSKLSLWTIGARSHQSTSTADQQTYVCAGPTSAGTASAKVPQSRLSRVSEEPKGTDRLHAQKSADKGVRPLPTVMSMLAGGLATWNDDFDHHEASQPASQPRTTQPTTPTSPKKKKVDIDDEFDF